MRSDSFNRDTGQWTPPLTPGAATPPYTPPYDPRARQIANTLRIAAGLAVIFGVSLIALADWTWRDLLCIAVGISLFALAILLGAASQAASRRAAPHNG